jgi:hypothetical protein
MKWSFSHGSRRTGLWIFLYCWVGAPLQLGAVTIYSIRSKEFSLRLGVIFVGVYFVVQDYTTMQNETHRAGL